MNKDNNKPKIDKCEKWTSICSIAAGSGIAAYSWVLRILAENKETNYSYLQAVGLHWGTGIIGGTVLYLSTKKPLLSAAIITGVGGFIELMQYARPFGKEMGTGTLEDALGNLGGAIIGAFAPRVVSDTVGYFKSKINSYNNIESHLD